MLKKSHTPHIETTCSRRHTQPQNPAVYFFLVHTCQFFQARISLYFIAASTRCYSRFSAMPMHANAMIPVSVQPEARCFALPSTAAHPPSSAPHSLRAPWPGSGCCSRPTSAASRATERCRFFPEILGTETRCLDDRGATAQSHQISPRGMKYPF